MENMLEIELKCPCADPRTVERKLKEEGAEFIEQREEVDTYFNHPCRDFMDTDEALRLRRVDDRVVLTYKGERIDEETKTRREVSAVVEGGDCRRILESLGFSKGGTVVKNRRVYRLEGVEICVDAVQDLGTFVELEVRGGDMDRGRGALFDMMERLGLEDTERLSYLELLMDRG